MPPNSQPHAFPLAGAALPAATDPAVAQLFQLLMQQLQGGGVQTAADADLASLAQVTARAAVATEQKETAGRSLLEHGVHVLPASSLGSTDGRPPSQRGYAAYELHPAVTAVVRVRADGKPYAGVAAAPGTLRTIRPGGDRKRIPQEVEVLHHENMRALDNAVATTYVAARLHNAQVDMPPPTVVPAPGQELLRYNMPLLGVPSAGEPSLARTMTAFDPKSQAKNLALSGAQFSKLYDSLVASFTHLETHVRVATSELLFALASGEIRSAEGTATTLCTHLLEVVRQHKLILGHETAIALDILKAPLAGTPVPPAFPINAAVENSLRECSDDELRKLASKRSTSNDRAAGSNKRARTGDTQHDRAVPPSTASNASVSNGGSTAVAVPAPGKDAGHTASTSVDAHRQPPPSGGAAALAPSITHAGNGGGGK
jgi:hypothetical protein